MMHFRVKLCEEEKYRVGLDFIHKELIGLDKAEVPYRNAAKLVYNFVFKEDYSSPETQRPELNK